MAEGKYTLQAEKLKGNWGTLLILDACRYDVFAKVVAEVGLPGELECVDTEVIGTAAWYQRHWQGVAQSTDIYAIIANPWGLRRRFKFRQIIRAWDHGADCTQVDPDRTMDYYRRFAAGERAMIHFIPPHQPFIGPKGEALYKAMGIDVAKLGGANIDNAKEFKLVARLMKRLELYGAAGHWPEIREAYRGTVELMVHKITDWLPEFRPPVIISADHGEVLGDGGISRGGFGHCHNNPKVIWIQRLVPWFECGEDAEISKRLEALGYA